MPNWVYNSVSATGPDADVQRLKEQVGKAYTIEQDVWDVDAKKHVRKPVENTDEFSFWNIVRPPEDKMHLYSAISDGTADKTWGWYEWNCANWGTKWDASDVSIGLDNPDAVSYNFQTAWSVPMEALVMLSAQYPSLTIQNEWEEEQGFGGTLQYENGEVTILDEYDVPSTHAEMIFRKDYCYCEDNDPDDLPFDDCPRDDNPLGISYREIEEEANV